MTTAMTTPVPLSMRVSEIRGLRTAWLEGGAVGQPILLFLHGYPDTADSWQLQMQYFQQHYHVVAPYSRGVKPSEKAADVQRYGHNALVLDQLQILRQVDPSQSKPIFIVGHDLGAVQAWELSAFLGKRLAGLVVINGLHIQQMIQRLRQPRQHLKSWYIYTFAMPKLSDKLLRRYPGKFLAQAHRLGGLPIAQRPPLKDVLGGVVNPINQYRAYIRDLPRTLTRQPRLLRRPVLVLWGDRDRFLLTPTTEEMDMVAAHYQVRIFAGNHWLHREQPVMMNQLMHESFRAWLH